MIAQLSNHEWKKIVEGDYVPYNNRTKSLLLCDWLSQKLGAPVKVDREGKSNKFKVQVGSLSTVVRGWDNVRRALNFELTTFLDHWIERNYKRHVEAELPLELRFIVPEGAFCTGIEPIPQAELFQSGWVDTSKLGAENAASLYERWELDKSPAMYLAQDAKRYTLAYFDGAGAVYRCYPLPGQSPYYALLERAHEAEKACGLCGLWRLVLGPQLLHFPFVYFPIST